MRGAIELLKAERGARLFFIAHTQSALGTGAGYVGLLLLAYDRLESPWAISIVLLADFVPAMFLGPVFGAAADRWSRRACAVVADGLRAVAFIVLALIDGFAGTVALALLAGVGTGLFTPAVLSGLPSLVDRRRLPAATGLYGAVADTGHMLGPALAALGLLFASAETLMLVNGLFFAASALLLARVPFGRTGERREGRRSLWSDARVGVRLVTRMRGVRTLILSSAAVVLAAGMFNVGELLLATEELGVGASGFSVLVGAFGAGVVAGSLAGSRQGSGTLLKRRYLLGILITGVGLTAAALAPVFGVAVIAFAVGGLGNGLVLVHERLLLQTSVRDDLLGRVFGLKDASIAWSFAIAFVSAGALLQLLGTRTLLACAGAGTLLAWGVTSWLLRGDWQAGAD